MKQQQKWSLFFVQKRMAVEPENQGDELDKDCEVEEPLKLQEPISSSSTTNTEKFQWSFGSCQFFKVSISHM